MGLNTGIPCWTRGVWGGAIPAGLAGADVNFDHAYTERMLGGHLRAAGFDVLFLRRVNVLSSLAAELSQPAAREDAVPVKGTALRSADDWRGLAIECAFPERRLWLMSGSPTRKIDNTRRGPAHFCEISADERIHDLHASVPEISNVSRSDGQTVDDRGRRNETILNRHGFPGCAKTRQQFCPLQARVRVPGQTVNTLDPFVEPAFQRSPFLAPGKDKYPES